CSSNSGAPDRDERVVEHAPVPLHDELVGAGDEVEVVPLVEHADDVAAEEVAGAAGAQAPPVDLLGRVDTRTESTVHGEYLVLDNGRQAQVVEDLRAVPPHVDASVLPEALVLRVGELSVLRAFIEASQSSSQTTPPAARQYASSAHSRRTTRYPVGVPDLERQQEQEGLHRVVAPVDEVAEEEVVLVGALAAHLEELDEVVELAVYVSAYLSSRRGIREGGRSLYVVVAQPTG
ncbi:hypothetical protein THAOC_24375, partial [Thalassiosira oceanica]